MAQRPHSKDRITYKKAGDDIDEADRAVALIPARDGKSISGVLMIDIRTGKTLWSDVLPAGGQATPIVYEQGGREYVVIVAAEGAGQDLMEVNQTKADASGNRRLGDIGVFLKDKINEFFRKRRIEVNLKYIDPSYIIRSVPASPQDKVYCTRLAQNAVHAAMAGKTNMLIGRWHSTFVHIPFDFVTQGRRRVDPDGDLWQAVLECTGQPVRIK